MKIDRKKVFDKFDGHCAYCGKELRIDNFQIDHLIPQTSMLKSDSFENLMPSCAACNNHKHSSNLEWWRHEIHDQANIALRQCTAMQRALKWGLIQITPHPIVFYFEHVKKFDSTDLAKS